MNGFSRIVRPLTNLLRKDQKFIWTDAAQNSFDLLKKSFTTAPLLAHPDPTRPYILETDASDYAISAVLSQYSDATNKPHPVAFYLRKMIPAEINYPIHDKELLAIIDSFNHWRPLLLGAHFPVTVFTDHKNLLHWSTAKKLNRRQVRWSQFIADYDYYIHYRPGSLGGKPDALSQRSDYVLKENNEHVLQQNKALLLNSQFVTETQLADIFKPHESLLSNSPEPRVSESVFSFLV